MLVLSIMVAKSKYESECHFVFLFEGANIGSPLGDITWSQCREALGALDLRAGGGSRPGREAAHLLHPGELPPVPGAAWNESAVIPLRLE